MCNAGEFLKDFVHYTLYKRCRPNLFLTDALGGATGETSALMFEDPSPREIDSRPHGILFLWDAVLHVFLTLAFHRQEIAVA